MPGFKLRVADKLCGLPEPSQTDDCLPIGCRDFNIKHQEIALLREICI